MLKSREMLFDRREAAVERGDARTLGYWDVRPGSGPIIEFLDRKPL